MLAQTLNDGSQHSRIQQHDKENTMKIYFLNDEGTRQVINYVHTHGTDRVRENLKTETGKNAWCFYPMSKRRDQENNWYTLPFDKRSELMAEHGKSGRAFAGRVIQLVTASAGFDDFEWGVTLFAVNPDDLKDVVYTMRFDEASAVYAEFGRFYTGMVTPVAELVHQI